MDAPDFFNYTDDNLVCPLSRAIIANDKTTLRKMLSKRRKTPQPLSADNRKWTALHVAASVRNSTECLDLLLQYEDSVLLDLNAESFDGRTALFIACERGCEENVSLLLQKGSDPAKKKLDGTSPLHISATKGYVTIVKYLLKAQLSSTPTHISLEGCKGKVVSPAIVYINDQDWQGFSALHLAAMHGHVEICRILLQNKANNRLTDSDGNTPLHLACQNGYFDIVRLLHVDDFSLIIQQNWDGITPLMLAVQNHNVDCVCYLLDHGARTEMYNKDKIIPLQFAAVGGNKDILELILAKTKRDFIEEFCLHNFTSVLDNKGMFYSLICCALNSSSVECLSLILESKLPRKILEAPYAENCGYCLVVFSPLAYLFSGRSESVDETFDCFLRLLLKHNIVYMKEFISELRIEWPESRVKFINPYGVIFSSEWPKDKKLPYFNLLNEHNITPDYCLICYNDNTDKFENFTVLLGYLTFYKPVLDAVCNGDIDTVQLFLSHSSVLEPDQLCYYLVVMKSSESSKEFNNNLKKVRSMYHYLIRLKPSYYNYERYPRAARFFDSFSKDEEFSRSNLQQLCRSVIREQLRGITLLDNLMNFRNRVHKLPLPSSLKNYLLFKN